MATNASYPTNSYPESIASKPLSIALVSPNIERRAAAALALTRCQGSDVNEFSKYPPVDDLPRLLEQRFDVVIIELDTDPEYALELVENIGSDGQSTLMVYSASADPDLLVRCMRAGARELLTLPLAPEVMAEALVRASARRPVLQGTKKASGKLLAFMGSKGGAGATMLACNFAVGLAKETTDQKTLLIDLDVPLGDAALNLGIVPEFSTIDALDAAERLDAKFLSDLVVKHSSGLMVLAAPGRFVNYRAGDEAINKLLQVARQEFDNVVVDLGSKLDLTSTAAYKDASALYLVTQASIPELRNSNRLISQFFTGSTPKLEIVINRYEARALGVQEEHITKALTRPAQWKIPNDYAAVRNMQINATPLVFADSAIARQIREMVNAVTGKTSTPARKKAFSLGIFS